MVRKIRTMDDKKAGQYIKSCQTEFWQKVFRMEADYILNHIGDSLDILSVGCGPAHIERILTDHGLNLTGIDISEQALAAAPDTIRKIIARAEDMSFAKNAFDAAIYVVSLQFIEDYLEAIKKTALALKPSGKIIVMLLNPESMFFREKASDSQSYISGIRHRNPQEIETVISEYFDIESEYRIGVRGESVFDSQNPGEAVLYIIRGTKKQGN